MSFTIDERQRLAKAAREIKLAAFAIELIAGNSQDNENTLDQIAEQLREMADEVLEEGGTDAEPDEIDFDEDDEDDEDEWFEGDDDDFDDESEDE